LSLSLLLFPIAPNTLYIEKTAFEIEMPDPVAEKSGFLKMYMSNHPDTLVAYAKWFGKVKETITSAEMSAIDTKVRGTLSSYNV